MGRRKKGSFSTGAGAKFTAESSAVQKLILPKNETMPFHLRTEFIFALGDALP